MQVVILGAGLIGKPMARDLARTGNLKVRVVDRDASKLEALNSVKGVETRVADATDLNILKKMTTDANVVINALPGFLGYQALKNLIELKRTVVDIAFFPEDAFTLDELAKKNGVTAIVDCGVAPGMSNLLVGYAQSILGSLEDVKIYVGGLPKVRQLPWEYKAVFSPVDVIEEYTRPARFRVDGKLITKEPLTDPEFIDFPEVGTLEAFNSDGLRSLLKTIDAPNMVEKTLRYPGHREKILFLKQSGLLENNPIEINGQKVSPLEITSRALFKQWELKAGDQDLTVMRIEARNATEGLRFDLLDYYDPQTGIHSMARTTGFTATIMTQALLQGMINQTGIIPPELLGSNHQLVNFVLEELKKRGVQYRQSKI